MRFVCVGLVLVLMGAALAGCGGEQAAPALVEEEVGDAYASDVLDVSYDGALNAAGQLALGTIQLEETEDAVTPEQAAALLPFWQALQGGVTARAEVNALMKQVEGTMADEQLQTIAAMRLTQEGMRVWMQGQGMGMGGGQGQGRSGGGGGVLTDDERATRQAEFGGGGDGEMPPEVATRRAEFENMSDEERAALRATMEAGGGAPGGFGRSGRGAGQFGVLLDPLIELLTLRAAE